MAEDRQTDTTQRATHWLLTVNNPTEDDYVKSKTNPRWLRFIRGQEEIGEQGTRHAHLYLNTDQVRWSAIKEWMPRANIKVLLTKVHAANAKEYVWKDDDTTVEGTKWEKDYRGESQALTFADTMLMMAQHAWSEEHIHTGLTQTVPGTPPLYKSLVEVHTAEFWSIVNVMLHDDPNLVGLLTQPQYMRAWINTRRVWIRRSREQQPQAAAPAVNEIIPPPDV